MKHRLPAGIYAAALISLLLLFFNAPASQAWFDQTHLAIAQASGYERWYNANGADIAKLKAGKTESYNHIFNNDRDVEITPALVLDQAARYNDPRDTQGHLYGAIIASLRAYRESTLQKKYAEYHLAYCVHYVGDLSQPLHSLPNDQFNKDRHQANDGIVDAEVLQNLGRIKAKMYPIHLRPEQFEKDLSREIARIAALSYKLGKKLRQENRDMTPEEAYAQLGHSAALFQAVLKGLGRMQ